MSEAYIDKTTGLPVRCPVCEKPTVQWTGKDWFCPDCAYVGEEALFPQKPVEEQVYQHPQPPEQYITLDLDPLSAAFLQRLSRKWDLSPTDAVVTLIKQAAKAEFANTLVVNLPQNLACLEK